MVKVDIKIKGDNHLGMEGVLWSLFTDCPTGVVGVGAVFVSVEFGCMPAYHFVRIK
jgi:hypothetical protein